MPNRTRCRKCFNFGLGKTSNSILSEEEEEEEEE
jgi:hypothetical protein